MRLCRFAIDEDVTLLGFYRDDAVVPFDQAAEAFADATGRELDGLTGETPSPLDLLPPDGPGFEAARELAAWVEGLDPAARRDLEIPTADLQLLTPLERPGKILLLARNYGEHSVESGDFALERSQTFPYLFLKPPSALQAPGAPIRIPKVSPGKIDWECELAVVVGRTCRHLDEARALEAVAGYTVLNDVSDRGFRPNPNRVPRERDAFFDWMHGKWHDTFCPFGPCVRSADTVPDPQTLAIRLDVNGERMQNASTAQMIFPVAAILAFASSILTLEPGDLIATGTPAGVGKARGRFLQSGDLVRAEIEGIGALVNLVEAEE